MFWIIHLIVGAVLGLLIPKIIGNYLMSFPEIFILSFLIVAIISFLSHFLFDRIPHWDGNFDTKGFIKSGRAIINKSDIFIRGSDFFLTLIFFFIIYFKNNDFFILSGMFFSLLPDLIKIFYFTPLRNNKLYLDYLKFHSRNEGDTTLLKGLMIQAITFILFLIILLILI